MAYTFKHGDRPLDGITVQRAVGRGGFGEVYYALTDSGKQVAVKYLRDNPEIELRGISHVMNLKSPHLITIYDVRKATSGEPFVIMEYVSGPSLRELMTAESSGMSVAKAAFLFSGICKGLSYLHERGIVHRDLKPANIFYDDGYVKIGDYGLSKHMSVSQHSGQTVSVGTVHYMAPEIGSGSYTKAIDIYAMGVILYEMLTGRLPFSGSSMAEILMKHVREQPNLMGVPQPFAAVIAKALAKDPSERYQDANEMLAAVMEHASFNQDAASFDASQLTVARRSEAPQDDDQTLTSPSPAPRPMAPPPLDARMAADPLAMLPDRLQKKFDRLSRKLEKKAAKLERKSGRRRKEIGIDAARRGTAPPPAEQAYSDVEVTRGGRFAQIAVIALIAVIASAGLDFLFVRRHGSYHDEPLLTVALVMALGGGLLGVMLAHFQILSRLITRSEMLDRFVYASMAGLFMLPSLGPGNDAHRQFGWVLVAPLACLMICNWNERIDSARRGINEGWGWSMFWPALVGFITVQIVDADRFNLVAAGLCALFSALTHTAAALWPYPPRPTTPIDGAAGPGVAPGASPNEPVARMNAYARPAEQWNRPDLASPPALGGAAWQAAEHEHVPPGAVLVQPVERSGIVRALFWLCSVTALFVSVGTFIGLMFVAGRDDDATAALLSMVLVSLTWQPFLLWKALHRHKRPLWYGTLRPLALTLVALGFIAIGMVSAFGDLSGDEWLAVLIPGALLFVAGMIVLFISGRPWREADLRRPAAAAPVAPAAIGEAIVYETRGHRSASIGAAFVTIGMLLALSAGIFVMREVRSQTDPAQEIAASPAAPAVPLVKVLPGPRSLPGPQPAPAPVAAAGAPEPPAAPLPPMPQFPGLNGFPNAINLPHAQHIGERLPMLVMAPLVIGTGFLVWSRRGHGWMPALRTAGGCGLLLALASSLMGGGVFGSHGEIPSGPFGVITYDRGVAWGEVAKLAGFAVGAAILLKWPRSVRRSASSTPAGF